MQPYMYEPNKDSQEEEEELPFQSFFRFGNFEFLLAIRTP